MAKPIVGIIMGSQSDISVMKEAAEFLEEFKIPFEVTVVSAHRTPARMVEYGSEARKRGLKVIIAGAGGAAHLPGMIASMTTLPVIGVPVKSPTQSTDGTPCYPFFKCQAVFPLLRWPSMVPGMLVSWQPKSWGQRTNQLQRSWTTLRKLCRKRSKNRPKPWPRRVGRPSNLVFLFLLAYSN